jgi:hypothetical protein
MDQMEKRKDLGFRDIDFSYFNGSLVKLYHRKR